MTATATPARTRLTPVQRDRLTAAAARPDGRLSTSTARRTAESLVAAGLATLVPAFDAPGAPSVLAITDAGRAAVGAPVPAEAEAAPEAAPVTCATCGQTLTEWTNHNGVTLLVAGDGWGSICGDAPRGEHAPAAEAAPEAAPVACPFCGAATVAPDPSRPEEQGHYCERCGRVASESAERPAPSMAAAQGEPVTQRHADYCAEHGHATHTVDGAVTGVCPRCGDVTVPAEDGPTVRTYWDVRAGDRIVHNGRVAVVGRDAYTSGSRYWDGVRWMDSRAVHVTVERWEDDGPAYVGVIVPFGTPLTYATAEPVAETVETLFVRNVRAGHVLTNRVDGRDLMVVGTDVEDVPGYVLVVPADDRQADPFVVQADEGHGYVFVLVGAEPVAYPGTAERVDAEPDAETVDAVTRAYLTTALWSSLNDDGESLDRAYLVSDVAAETAAQARRDVADFLAVVGAEDVAAYVAAFGGDAGQIGHDLWLTRNHGGAGFWDRGLGELGDRLTLWADALGTADFYVGDDGRIYGA